MYSSANKNLYFDYTISMPGMLYSSSYQSGLIHTQDNLAHVHTKSWRPDIASYWVRVCREPSIFLYF